MEEGGKEDNMVEKRGEKGKIAMIEKLWLRLLYFVQRSEILI
jgi:hypothetical protein